MSDTTADAANGGLFKNGEVESAFGGDLGPGPAASAAVAINGGAPAKAATVQLEHEPTWAEFGHGWEIGIYRDPVLCGISAGLVLGVLGVFIVLRRAVFVTAAISQSAALGVALAFLAHVAWHLNLPPVVAALILALAATATLAARPETLKLPRETVVGFGYLAASAAAILVGDRITQEAHDIASILFGTAVVVRPVDLALVLAVGALVLLTTVLFYRGLLFSGFDPEGARVQGLPVRLLELSLWALVALEVSVTTRALGALPVFAFAVLPAMTALAVVERAAAGIVLAAAIGAAAGGLGYLCAFFLGFPVGACQTTLAALGFLFAVPVAWARRRGS